MISQLQAITAVHEYNDRQEPEKPPYEHSNRSDETLVDSSHETVKSHEARSGSARASGRIADPTSQVHRSEDHPPTIHHTPSASDSDPKIPSHFVQTPTPPPTPPSIPWSVKGRKPPKGRVIIVEDTTPSDEEMSPTPLSVLPPDVLGASFGRFEVQETIEQVLERIQSC